MTILFADEKLYIFGDTLYIHIVELCDAYVQCVGEDHF
jgi:hypothetical protein